ncbi:class F sortase [Exiguobacterium acetylicum]|uniref:class F sortase n=1 Tax=Exiguobacterium acetylicum TaxID=41170 RepID=UPI001EE3A216|nr:class F sortase [Exiguobacterium acetylicum]UKS56347.1 class F sortase [Exiguobacterium acetylicum]
MSSVVNKTLKSSLLLLLVLAGCQSGSLPEKTTKPDQPKVTETTPSSSTDSASVDEEAFIPTRIVIPTLDVKTNIEVVGKDKQGRMDVPKQTDQVAWYKYGAKAGQTGNVVLAGHLDDKDGPAVFYDLAKLKKGQRIEVTGKAGQQVSYVVTNVMSYPVDEAPVGSIFGATVMNKLTLISCIGTFSESKGYDQRLVVTAEQDE